MTRAEVNVLIVDDVNSMRLQIKELIKSFGFKLIQTASSAEEAMALLEIDSFHMLLCDWQMGSTSGLDLLRHVRAHGKYQNLPFIMVTAETTKDQVVLAIKSGVDDYLVKPLTRAQIESKVYGVLLRKKVLE
jgi:two-component system, chemotaxis family, chemotaxis protein CheY